MARRGLALDGVIPEAPAQAPSTVGRMTPDRWRAEGYAADGALVTLDGVAQDMRDVAEFDDREGWVEKFEGRWRRRQRYPGKVALWFPKPGERPIVQHMGVLPTTSHYTQTQLSTVTYVSSEYAFSAGWGGGGGGAHVPASAHLPPMTSTFMPASPTVQSYDVVRCPCGQPATVADVGDFARCAACAGYR